MRSKRNRRRGKRGFFGVWMLAGLVLLYGGIRFFEKEMTDENWNIGRAYISNIIGSFVSSQNQAQGEENGGKAVVSRGKTASRESGVENDALASVGSDGEGNALARAGEAGAGTSEGADGDGDSAPKGQAEGDSGIPWLLEGFLDSALPVASQVTLGAGDETTGGAGVVLSQEGLSGQSGISALQTEAAGNPSPEAGSNPPQPAGGADNEAASEPDSQPAANPNVVSSPIIDGAVLIYHTHSTESYEPYSDGNYHSIPETGTVREVGTHLAERLKSKGITVYHDQTLHDSPSYNSSYIRSLDTLQRQLAARPEIQVVIDLHRDASASGKKYATTTVNGKAASSFNVVVGNKNKNYRQLLAFANAFIEKANELYPGLGGRVIEREYKFNGYMSDYALLLEVGNNLNTIDEVNVTGNALGDVVEAIMREL